MATKLNKVFLNPTEDQIKEYGLEKGKSWFEDMDALAAALEADQKKKLPERTYSLNNFQIIDGAREIKTNLTKIAKVTGFTLSNDLSKVLDWVKTEIDYDVDHVTDHRVASTAADGTAELSGYDGVANTTKFMRSTYEATPEVPPTAAGQEAYEEDIEDQIEAYDVAGSPVDTKIIGYKDVTLTNIGSKATAEEEGETYKERNTVVTQYSTVDVEGGDASFDYQYDATKAVDKKDAFLVTETGKETAKASATAVGTLTVKDSVIGSVGASFSENAAEIKSLHSNENAQELVDDLVDNAGAFETVVIENSTVLGDVAGGKVTIDNTRTVKNETFLDKPEESGFYYNATSGDTEANMADNNTQLYVAVDNRSVLTEEEVQKFRKEGLTVTSTGATENVLVNRYTVRPLKDVNGADIPGTGNTYVYLTATEYANLSDASKAALDDELGSIVENFGYVDYSADRVVTDANFLTFNTAPAGAATAVGDDHRVNKYVYQNDAGKKVTYYLTAAEEAPLAGAVGKPIYDAGYKTKVVAECVEDGSFRRVAVAGTVDDTNYLTAAVEGYNTVSVDYKQYRITSSMSDAEALALNKEVMSNGVVWIKGGLDADNKALFCMSKFTLDGSGNSVETKYYLTASEMSDMGFFGKDGFGNNIFMSYEDIRDTADPNFLKLQDWAFTDNAVADARVYADMYREGAAATTATLENYTTDKTAVVTDVIPNVYTRGEISYTANAAAPNRLSERVPVEQFNELVANNLVGAGNQYVTVIDGAVVNMYQIAGYSATATVVDPATITAGRLTLNDAEINYDAVIQKSYWDGDAKIAENHATLVNGVKTQNTKYYFDSYASNDGKYVYATAAEQEAGEKVHNFVIVAETRFRDNNQTITYDEVAHTIEVVTDVQAKMDDGGGNYVAAYLDRNGAPTTEAKAADPNKNIFYYEATDGNIYALTSDEAGRAVTGGALAAATKLNYYTTANDNGWFASLEDAKTTLGETAKQVDQPIRRDASVAIAAEGNLNLAAIEDAEYFTLKQSGNLTNDLYRTNEKLYVTELHNTVDDGPGDYSVRALTKDGQEAYVDRATGELVANAETTYDTIYKWNLKATPGGALVDGLVYYMTKAEKEIAKTKIGDGYPATAVFEMTEAVEADAAWVVGGNYQYRVSKTTVESKDDFLSDSKRGNFQLDEYHAELDPVENPPAYTRISYVIGAQVYKYTIEGGDGTAYYLSEDDAAAIGGGWGGALIQGDAVEGVAHYGVAAAYEKAAYTTPATVYHFTDSYAGECITQDAEGNAAQAFDEQGAIWSNIDGVTWNGGLSTYSYVPYEMCDNTYYYNYNAKPYWTPEQIQQIVASEEASGVATWKYEEKDGQVVWTRTTPLGEVSTYVMNHENVDVEGKENENFRREAIGSIEVKNGSEVKGTISGYLNVTVTDSKVANVEGGNATEIETKTLSTSKGAISKKDNSRTITTKETEKEEETITGAGTFTISRKDADQIYVDAVNVSGYETVSVDGVNTGALSVENTKTTEDTTRQTTYQGDADALRSDYINDWRTLAFTKGIVSKITNETEKEKTVTASMGSAEITGRDYTYVPGTGMDKANTVGDITGYKTVTLTNANAGNITTEDSTEDNQTTYKLSTKKNVDTATETVKEKTETKVVAELTAVNDVTNPELEADLVIGDIEGYKTVTLENYSFGNANAVGEKTVSHSTSSVRDAVASDMRLVNAGVDRDTGAVVPGNGLQKYSYEFEPTGITGTSYKKNGTSYSSDTSTKRNAVGTLEATGRAYTAVLENYTEALGKDPVYAYTQTATGRTVYLTEDQFEAIQSNSKADAAQWTKDEKTVVYYRNSDDAVAYDGAVAGTQVVYECSNTGLGTDHVFVTQGEIDNYNLFNPGDKLTKVNDKTYLRVGAGEKATFNSNVANVISSSGNIGSVVVKEYSKAGSANQFLTEAEATAGGWTKVNDDEFVRKDSKADSEDRSSSSLVGNGAKTKAQLTSGLKVYQNKYNSSVVIALTEDEAKFIADTSDKLADYELATAAYYRLGTINAGIVAVLDDVPTYDSAFDMPDKLVYGTTIVEAHSYVMLNEFGQITAQEFVTADEFSKMSKDGGSEDLKGYVLDDGTHVPTEGFAPTYKKALTQYQYRDGKFEVAEATTLATLHNKTTALLVAPNCELYGWALTDEQAAAAGLYVDEGKSKFVLAPVTEPVESEMTHFGNIYGYKDVTLTGMEGGNIYRIAEGGAIKADNETDKQTYKKTISKGTGKNKGKTTYTENATHKTSETWSAAGTVTVTDSDVSNIAGYKTVNVQSDKGEVKVGLISRTTQDGAGVWDKHTEDTTTKAVTEDTTSSFKVTTTTQTKTTTAGTAAGSVKLIGKRAGEALVLDDKVFKTIPEAEAEAAKAIAAHGKKQYADLQIKANGGVIGYQDVVVENASIIDDDVQFVGGKYTETETENHTTVTITDNNGDTVTVMNKINDSTNSSSTATGSLTLTNVNYASAYAPGHEEVDHEGYTEGVNEYVFNGVTYALTADEQAALLKYGIPKEGPAGAIVNRLREDATVTPAIELIGTLQDVANVKGVKATDADQDTVYFAAKDGAGTELYVRSDKVDKLLKDGIGLYTKGGTVDTSKAFYSDTDAEQVYAKNTFDDDHKLAANVKKYVITDAEGAATTYYLTDAEFSVMKNVAGANIAAASDTADYTRMTDVGAAVNFVAGNVNAADNTTTNVFKYRGVETNTGKSAEYYLTESEAADLVENVGFEHFGKVGTTVYYRHQAENDLDYVDAGAANYFKKVAVAVYDEVRNLRTEVLEYTKAANPPVYMTKAEFDEVSKFTDAYAGYATDGTTKKYRQAESAYTIANKAALDSRYTSVNESAEVYEISNNISHKVLGYLTLAEILALRENTDFDDNYDLGDMYYRAAGDNTKLVKINAFKEGDGYVLADGVELPEALYIATATPDAIAPATAKGYQKVTLTNATLGDVKGGNHTEKTTAKLAAKKNSTMATYTTTEDETYTATGFLTAEDSAVGDASWYEKVTLTASKMDKAKYHAGNIKGGKTTSSEKTVYTTQLQAGIWDGIDDPAHHGYGKPEDSIEWTRTTKENETATGKAELTNVVAGNITRYKDVTVSFDEAIDDDPDKNKVGSITGGNKVTNETETTAKVYNIGGADTYGETVTKETVTSVGTVNLTNVYADGDVSGFATANVTDSEITGSLTGGNIVTTTTEVDVDGVTASRAIEHVVTAAGKANVEASTVGGNIAQFKDVVLTGREIDKEKVGVVVHGDIVVGGDDDVEVKRSLVDHDEPNIPCYAVFYTAAGGVKKVVYLTAAEYKVFATQEITAMIDTTVSVYRDSHDYPLLSDDELKDAAAATGTMKGFVKYTDNLVFDDGAGQEGRDTEIFTVKTWGNSLTIDEFGATVDGKVEGYAKVTVSGDSSFGAGYFGTDKADKLTVDEKVGLATFTTPGPLNPVGFDFGDGKDELVLNGTIGIQAAFKYDEEAGTNAWNLEKVSGEGTIVCRTEDAKDVEAAFDGIKVYGSDNYNAENALAHQTVDDALDVDDHDDIDQWLGFCDDADFFRNDTGADAILSFSGDSVKSGDIIAQMSVDGGKTWGETLNNGATVYDGALVKVQHVSTAKNTVSNDYMIAFK